MFRKYPIILLLIFSTIVSGCNGGTPPIVTPVIVEIPSLIPPTQAPTPTAVPEATRVLISTGSQLPEADIKQIIALVQSLAGQSNLTVETISSLTPEALTPDVKVVIVLPPDPGIVDLTSRYLGIRFVAIAVPSIQSTANLFAIGVDGSHPEWSGFMAGYIAAILTNEWRVGALTQAGLNEGLLAGDGFRNGAMFYCGLCNPSFPPFTDYPIAVEMNPAATQPEWQPIADAFIASGVKTAYIYPGIANPEMMAYLAQGGMKLIGSQTPPDTLRPAWFATVQVDYNSALQSVWGDVLSGAAGRVVWIQMR